VVAVTSSEVRFQDKVCYLLITSRSGLVLTSVLFDLFSFVYQLLDLKLYIEFTFASIVGLLFMIRLVLDLQICVMF
jgi:hypothetical protein